MSAIIGMIHKDLLRRWRAPLAPLLVLAFPLVFATLIGLAFGGGDQKVPKVRLLLDDRDDGLVGNLLSSALSRPEAAQYFDVSKVETGQDGLARLEKEGFSALLRLPPDLTESLLDNRPTKLTLVRNPSQSILPEVAEQVTLLLADGLSAASTLLRGPLNEVRPYLQDGGGAPSEAAVAAIAVSVQRNLTGAGPYLFPPVIRLETVQLDRAGAAPSPGTGTDTPLAKLLFLLTLPGVTVFALFTLADQGMRDLLAEGRLHTLQRQLSGPVGAGTVVTAKAASTAVVLALGLLVIAPFAAWAAAGRKIDVPALVVQGLALILAAIGFAAALYGLMRNERQGATLGSLFYLAMAFSGGSFIPLDSLPGALRRLAPFSPFYWASEGFKELLARDGTFRDVLPNIAILTGMGVVLLALGSFLLRRRVLRGAAA